MCENNNKLGARLGGVRGKGGRRELEQFGERVEAQARRTDGLGPPLLSIPTVAPKAGACAAGRVLGGGWAPRRPAALVHCHFTNRYIRPLHNVATLEDGGELCSSVGLQP